MTAPSQRLASLLQTLQAEEILYVELRSLLERERNHMLQLDGAGLEEVAREKEALAAEARFLEEGRVELAARLAAELGLEEQRTTLARLCDALGPAGAELGEARSRLTALLGAVRELLDLNADFAGECLGQVRATLQLLGRLAPPRPTYGPTASAVAEGGRLVRHSA